MAAHDHPDCETCKEDRALIAEYNRRQEVKNKEAKAAYDKAKKEVTDRLKEQYGVDEDAAEDIRWELNEFHENWWY